MQISRINTFSNKKSFGAKFSQNVEQAIVAGQKRYQYDADAISYYNKRVEQARQIAPDFSVTTKVIDRDMVNPYGKEIVLLQKSKNFVREPLLNVPLHIDNLDVYDLETLEGITMLCECLKIAHHRIYRKGMEQYFKTKPSKEIKKLLQELELGTAT